MIIISVSVELHMRVRVRTGADPVRHQTLGSRGSHQTHVSNPAASSVPLEGRS